MLDCEHVLADAVVVEQLDQLLLLGLDLLDGALVAFGFVLDDGGSLNELLILKEVTSDRSRLLEYCNTDTANNPGVPIFTHGRDVLLQKRKPIALIARLPELLSLEIDEAPPYAAEKRDAWLRQEISGDPFVWGGDDLERLYRNATTAVM